MALPAEPPPDYDLLDHATFHHETALEALLEQQDAFFKTHVPPPQPKHIVRDQAEPSSWKLLIGPSMSNAPDPLYAGESNPSSHKRRYKVVYPPSYSDVYLHKSPWQTSLDQLPRYHVHVFGKDRRYEPEPIIVLGPHDHDDALTNEAQIAALALLPKAFARIDAEIAKTARFATFCESEYCAWDWSARTDAAKRDMRALMERATRDCVMCAGLTRKLEQLLEFVRRDGESQEGYLKWIRLLRRKVEGATRTLDRLWL